MLAILPLAFLFILLLESATRNQWRTCLLVSLVISFLQDPVRKLTPGQPGLMVGISLVAFSISALCIWNTSRFRLTLAAILLPAPRLHAALSTYLLLITAQLLSAIVQWGNYLRALIGLGFYLSPILGLWLGYVVGLDAKFFRKFLRLYVVLSAVFAITVFLDYLGVDIPLFKEVGGGILIHVVPGFSVFGSSGLWRSSELAAWHLAASSCLSLCLGASLPAQFSNWPYYAYSAAAAILSIATGRRKALVQIVVFLGIYFFFADSSSNRFSRAKVFSVLLAFSALLFFLFFLAPQEVFGPEFSLYLQRSSTSAASINERLSSLVGAAFLRALQISNGIGLGVGTLAQTGGAKVAAISGSSFVFVSESGLGKIVAELGFFSLILLPVLLYQLWIYVLSCLKCSISLPGSGQLLYVGCFSFAFSNLFFFSAAAGVYGDPGVLIICGICLGSVMSVPQQLASFKQSPLT